MTETELVGELKQAPFSSEQYASVGMSEQYMTRMIDGYSPKLKISMQSVYSGDPLIRLVSVTRAETFPKNSSGQK